ncbi:hypothetical protein CYMTET_54396 [Cymbomonas tetramitiformis]|uniref:Uncharacterized protein n=1 Tax=Cymbomonas tetramitiformis TaxID=36881 RepID=A0AAE0EPM1_9CHLO|nr:hypothetical protein CYMTET_54396 [Cymbomonas tetramitiformis]|eukprot:gene23562-28533_t
MSGIAALRKVATPAVARSVRSFNTTSKTLGGEVDEYFGKYVHAKHMYDVASTPNRKLVFGSACIGALAFGFGVPVFAVNFQLSK